MSGTARAAGHPYHQSQAHPTMDAQGVSSAPLGGEPRCLTPCHEAPMKRPSVAVIVDAYYPYHRAVISGDTLVDFGQGLEINERWLRPGVTREEIAEGLRPLLALPVEHVLATHGRPTDRVALERALA